MRYRVWTFQDPPPPRVVRHASGAPVLPSALPEREAPKGRASEPEEFDNLPEAVDRIMGLMKGNGLNDEVQEVIVRGRAAEALRDRGAYRTALPAQGRWVLAEQVIPGRKHPLTGEVS